MISITIPSIVAYHKLAGPFVESIRRFEPDKSKVEVILINNTGLCEFPPGPYRLLITGYRLSCAEVTNLGFSKSRGSWLMFCNDDSLCKGPFYDIITALDKEGIYGQAERIKKGWVKGDDLCYVTTNYFIMRKDIYKRIGPFNELFEIGACEDIEYCWRATKLGIPVRTVSLPIEHLLVHSRNYVPRFKEIEIKNREILMRMLNEEVDND